MSEPTTSANESSIDALRRRARRRLVGAAVLAVLAAVLLPWMFEKEPPPLPDDVDIRIPNPDKTPFDTKPPAMIKDAAVPKPAPDVIGSATQVASAGSAPLAVTTPAGAVQGAITSVAPKQEEKKAPEIAKKAEEKPVEKKSTDNKEADKKASEKKEVAPTVANTSANNDADGPKTAPVAGDYVVQLIAVRDSDAAKKVLERARALGYKSAYRETVTVPNGVVTRIRVGPYKDKSFAEKIRGKLAEQQFEPVVVPIK